MQHFDSKLVHAKKYEKFNFDHWKDLHEKNPQKFERERQRALLKAISSTSTRNQKRLQGLVFQIDTIRSRNKPALKTCLEISELMWQSFDDLYDALHHYEEFSRSNHVKFSAKTSNILEFKK